MYLVIAGNEYGFDFNLFNPMEDSVKFIPTLEEAEAKFDEYVDEDNFAVIMYELVIPEPGSAYMCPRKTHMREF